MAEQNAPAAPAMPQTVKSDAPQSEPTVTMIFPHPVLLTVHATKRIHFREGIQQVPESLKDHFYLKAHGVKLYVPNAPVTAKEEKPADVANREAQEKALAEEQKRKAEEEQAAAAAKAQADEDKRKAEEQQVADAAASARTGKPVEQIRKDREAKSKAAK